MADAVTTTVIYNLGSATATQNAKTYIAHFTNLSDGTGETNVIKVDKSTLFSTLGIEPVALDIQRIEFTIQGYKTVKISWDHDTDDTAVVLGTGVGFLDFTGGLYLTRDFGHSGGLQDPRSTGGTGDILFTTSAGASGNSYSITLFLTKRAV
jgi:hypothetical protein